MSWDQGDWEISNEDARESNGMAFQKSRRENFITELQKIEGRMREGGLSENELQQLVGKRKELSDNISFLDKMLGYQETEAGAE